uniref:Response regulator receiver domain-containing protein n=1 Tax=Candidatus Kentrum sp. MB TaxID=2138164 RepID=A0A451B921_9GAMM|nr:MAG: Response regulator receiver domain-containing protein [Candidatus Kentron sp. MB]VFK74762.1 MAG: Response regulator receiver domain-containing protein [Candidatus Kentron sp. MB]
MPQKLLVIDDSDAFREAITWAGEDHGWVVYADDNLERVQVWLAQHAPDVVLLDWQLPGQQRRKYAELLQGHRLTERTLLLSGAMNDERRAFITEYGLAGGRLKPLDLNRFEEEIRLPDSTALMNAGKGGSTFSDEQLVAMIHKIPAAVDILDGNLDIFWSNERAKQEEITREQRLIMKWLQVELDDETKAKRNIVRRLDWDGKRERFLESKLYRINNDFYVLERDWRDQNEQLYDHAFLNLEDGKDLALDDWLQAVARLLAQRYAISRFRVYKISPLPYTEGLESTQTPLVEPKFQTGGGIEPEVESWLRGGFEPRQIPHIEKARHPGYKPAPMFVDDKEDTGVDKSLARVRYGETGTSHVLFPVRTVGGIVALLALDRRLDHVRELQGFDREVVQLAMRMASDDAGALSHEQWPLMRGLIEDIGRRVGIWLREDEERRIANWHTSISNVLINTFAATVNSPEMTYEGISQVFILLARVWNEEKISGIIQGSTPFSEQSKKGAPISDWYLVLIIDDAHWQAVAGWGEAYETYRQQEEQMSGPPPRLVADQEAWKALMIQDFQSWSRKARGVSHNDTNGDGETGKAIGSWLAVPMQAEGRIRAAMVVHSPHAHYFTAFHTRLMEDAARGLLPLLAAAMRETRARSAFTAAVMHEIKNDSHAALMLLDQAQGGDDQAVCAESLIEMRHHLESLNDLGEDTLDVFQIGRSRYIQKWRHDDRDMLTTPGELIKNAILGWHILYEDTKLDVQLPEDLAARKIRVSRTLAFKRVLRVLLHNAFRHGFDWVHVGVELQDGVDVAGELKLTIRNGAYDDVISNLNRTFGSATDNPGASPLIRGRLGLAVARQLTLEARGALSKLQYEQQNEDEGEATIILSWPIRMVS